MAALKEEQSAFMLLELAKDGQANIPRPVRQSENVLTTSRRQGSRREGLAESSSTAFYGFGLYISTFVTFGMKDLVAPRPQILFHAFKDIG